MPLLNPIAANEWRTPLMTRIRVSPGGGIYAMDILKLAPAAAADDEAWAEVRP